MNPTATRRRHRTMTDRAMTYALAAATTDRVLYDALRTQSHDTDWRSDDGRYLTDELDQLPWKDTR